MVTTHARPSSGAHIPGQLCRLALLTILVMSLLAAGSLPAGAQGTTPSQSPVKVMTRNLYLGADLAPLASATSAADLVLKAAALFEKVQATDFPARAKVLAREIQAADPSVVGLQEVAMWRTGQPGVLDGPVTPATTVVYDFLQLLQSELATLGSPYTVVRVQSEVDAEMPTAFGFDIRLTLQDAILAKAALPADELILSNANSGNYATNLIIPSVVGPIPFTRGWTAVDVTVNKRTFRFINTHLEAGTDFHRFAQSAELLSGPANTALPVILVGDLNSAPDESGPYSAYAHMIDAGFADTWTLVNPSAAGFTCCHAENLLNPTPTLTTRIDHVLVRPGMAVFRATLSGTDQDNRTPSGLWPSDHAGVVVTLKN